MRIEPIGIARPGQRASHHDLPVGRRPPATPWRQTTHYAAEVTTGDGSPARYVKGMVIDSDGKDSSAGSYVHLTNALKFLQSLPNNIDEARRRAFQDPDSGLRSSIDTRA
jgi:hypothetical protein